MSDIKNHESNTTEEPKTAPETSVGEQEDLVDKIMRTMTPEKMTTALAVMLVIFAIASIVIICSLRKEIVELGYTINQTMSDVNALMENAAVDTAEATVVVEGDEFIAEEDEYYDYEYYIPPKYDFGTRSAEAEQQLSGIVSDYIVEQIYNYTDVSNSFFFFEGEDKRTSVTLYDNMEEYMRSAIAKVNAKDDGTYAITSCDGRTFTMVIENTPDGSTAVTLLTDDTERVFVTGRAFLETAGCIEYNESYSAGWPEDGYEGDDCCDDHDHEGEEDA